jgi:hypothetical protein
MAKTTDKRYREALRTLETEIGAAARQWAEGSKGLGDLTAYRRNLILNDMHLGRSGGTSKTNRKLIRAVVLMLHCLGADALDTLEFKMANADQENTAELRDILAMYWREAQSRGRGSTTLDDAQALNRYKGYIENHILQYARREVIDAGSSGWVPGAPVVGFALQEYRGNIRGRTPPTRLTKMAINWGQDARRLDADLPFYQHNIYITQYFLPWSSGNIAWMQIPAAGLQDKRVFLTSSLSGCSVFIRGPANSPSIYHCGIDGTALTIQGALPHLANLVNNAALGRVRTAIQNGDSKQFWWDLLALRLGGVLQGNQTPAAQNVGAVSKHDYGYDGQTAPVRIRGRDNRVTPRLAHVARNYRAALGRRRSELLSISGSGFVFGVRLANGNWTFYLQERALIGYTRYDGRRTANKIPIRLTRVWPYPKRVVWADYGAHDI